MNHVNVPSYPGDLNLDLHPRWTSQFPASVETNVNISWKPDSLDLEFNVKEPQIRAMETDPWLVHRDSCVEFFISVPGTEEYLNIETNPVGLMLVAQGEGRENRRDIFEKMRENISMEGTYAGHRHFHISGDSWRLKLSLNPAVVGLRFWDSETPLSCNIYKCGDALSSPHYLSLTPLSSEQPDFHRPQDFIKLQLQSR